MLSSARCLFLSFMSVCHFATFMIFICCYSVFKLTFQVLIDFCSIQCPHANFDSHTSDCISMKSQKRWLKIYASLVYSFNTWVWNCWSRLKLSLTILLDWPLCCCQHKLILMIKTLELWFWNVLFGYKHRLIILGWCHQFGQPINLQIDPLIGSRSDLNLKLLV